MSAVSALPMNKISHVPWCDANVKKLADSVCQPSTCCESSPFFKAMIVAPPCRSRAICSQYERHCQAYLFCESNVDDSLSWQRSFRAEMGRLVDHSTILVLSLPTPPDGNKARHVWTRDWPVKHILMIFPSLDNGHVPVLTCERVKS
jgi:hypothetical protein